MASEAANIGANFSQYSGDAGLGGSSLGVLKINTTPLEDLAKYTMLYNKAEYDQRQKNADEMIAEIAKQTSININDLYGKDREEFQKQFLDFNKYLSDFARKVPQTPAEKLKMQTEYLQKRQQINSDYLSGQARAIKFVKDKNEIESDKTLSDATKSELLKQLDDKFNQTKISEQFTSVPRYDLVPITLPSPLTADANIIQEGPNANLNDKLTFYNFKTNNQSAFGILNGISKLYPSAQTPEGQTSEARQQRTIESEAKAWTDSAQIFNGILQKYLVPDTANPNVATFDEQRFINDNANNKTIMQSYLALKNMDADARAKYQQALTGKLSDRGFNFNLPPNVTPDDFRYGFVDFTKPIEPEQIVNAGIYSHYLGDKSVKTVQPTDNAIQKANLDIARGHLDIDRGQLKLAQDKWKESMTGGETVKNGALERAHRIYDDMLKLADNNGVISPDKLRQLNTEQLKYLGIEKVTESTTSGLPKSVFEPLTFEEKTPYAIQLINGEIKILKNANKLDNGRYTGEWDNSKSTNVFNVGTNILNEELQKAGTKELNSYMPIDLGTGGVSVNQTGGTTTLSTTKTNDLSGYDIPTGAKVVYNKDGKVLGYELKGKKFKFE